MKMANQASNLHCTLIDVILRDTRGTHTPAFKSGGMVPHFWGYRYYSTLRSLPVHYPLAFTHKSDLSRLLVLAAGAQR